MYEFRVAGEVGAVILAAISGFSATTVARQSVLTGRTDRLETILALLTALDRRASHRRRIEIVRLPAD